MKRSKRKDEKQRRNPKQVTKWREVDEDMVEEDGLILAKGDEIRWNTYKKEMNLCKWKEVPFRDGMEVVDLPDVQYALAVALTDRRGVDEACRVDVATKRTFPKNGVVQIPFRNGESLEILSFRPLSKLVSPDDSVHRVQRRVHRYTGVDLSSEDVSNTLRDGRSVSVKEGVTLTKEGKSVILVFPDAKREKIFP